MKTLKYREQIIRANFSTLRYVSLITLGFSIYFLISDFVFPILTAQKYIALYKSLDIAIAIVSIIAVAFFWIHNSYHDYKIMKVATIVFPFIILTWAAVITGIDFQVFGLSTYITVLLFCTFYLYFEIKEVIFIYATSCLVLFTTIYFNGNLTKSFLPFIFLIVPVVVFSILVSVRNFKNKIKDLENQDEILSMNKKLQQANENLEKEVELRTKEIMIALEKAKESNRLKTTFLQNISHEIRTPLNGVAGFAKLIAKPDLPPEKISKYSELIINSSERIIRIVNDVIEISQIQTNQTEVKISGFSLQTLIDEIKESFIEKAKEQNIEMLFIRHETSGPREIFSDRRKIETIIAQLLDNALKFTQQGSVTVTYGVSNGMIDICVTDTGIGIANEMKSIIFEPFRQVESEMFRNYGGNGLGLAIVKAYVELLGGTITLKSELNKGSSFFVSIPANNSDR